MRFNTPIYFQTVTAKYDASTGDYGEDEIAEVKRYASVTSAGDEVLKLMYGELKQGCLVIRLQNQYKAPFDRIRIGDKLYSTDKTRQLSVKHIFIVSEVQ